MSASGPAKIGTFKLRGGMSVVEHSVAGLLFHDRAPFACFIVISYFLAAVATFWASRSARKRDWVFWTGVTLLLVLLGLNKELDLQTLLTTEGRRIALHGGWYDERRLIQGLFLLGLATAGILAIGALIRWLRKSAVQVKSAAIGIVLLFTFVVMRAGSFHHLEKWVTINIAGLRSGWWLELAGIAVIGLSAFAYRVRRKQR